MTMRYLLGTALAAGLWLAFSGASWANDTVRLGGPSAQADIDGGTDTALVHRRGFYGRGGWGGYGYGRSYYGGGYGRSFYGGGYGYGRSYYGGGFYGGYRPYYSSYYHRPYYYSSYYYQPAYYGSYYYPCAGEFSTGPQVSVLSYQVQSPQMVQPQIVQPQVQPLQQPLQQQQGVPLMPPATPSSGTFRYDGDPRSVVPMPSTNPAPAAPNGIIPIDGRLVSMPTGVGGGVSFVGMQAQRPATPSQPRVAYPAYGEEPLPAVPRKR
jgi:hypothetical protein